MDHDLVAALDIGGTKIAGALVDRDGVPHHRTRLPTPARETGDRVFAAVAGVLGALRSAPGWDRVTAVGIGSAGPVDARRGTVSPVNIPGWRDYPLVEGVRAAVGGLPVTLVGDGVAMTAAEHAGGAARGCAGALGMVVSTGVGGGLVLDGRPYPGPTGNAGHIGHLSVDLDGERCPCGGRGCVERLASGPSIVRHARALGWRPGDGEDAGAAGVAAAARAGHPAAEAAFARAARALAAAIAATAALTEIETAVIGGGVAQAGDVLFGPLRAALADYATLSFVRGLRVVPAAIGNDAGLVGAAAACRAAATGPAAAAAAGTASAPDAQSGPAPAPPAGPVPVPAPTPR
ncbi:ROK family protein [Streptomyces sp. TRM 70351]|uniref:ROK family protein n=1 Tax=Streptomyces sp. TRM 70351 TaxID=3116552 RepID=UPI002E7B7260|nr:ROK family protein [Streptomyces sp. TRM 70351]MEE1927260.1 ROK family protein [Streptomyces sp. TRM 70351]